MSKRIEFSITDDMKTYLEKVLKTNKSINLTRVSDIDQAMILHLEDSLAVVEELSKAPDGLYADLGSGGGFPGVPLALASGRKTILVDSVQKKMAAVQNILDEMNLSNQISTYNKRIEELALEQLESFSVVTARALTSIPSLMELASPLLKQEGRLIALKSKEEEDFSNKLLEEKLGLRKIDERSYYLNDEITYRVVHVFEKYKTLM